MVNSVLDNTDLACFVLNIEFESPNNR
jgi:hypothetical protein